MKSWLHDNGIEMYSRHNEGKSVVAERFIRTLKNTIYGHVTAVSKHMYIDKLDEIVEKYSSTCHRTIRMEPAYVKSGKYIQYGIERNGKGAKFKFGSHVRISKYKNILAKAYKENWSVKVFGIKKIENYSTMDTCY